MISYNHRPFIAQALDSVLQQRRSFAIEIVISDDCSPDGTASVIDSYQASNPGLFRRLDPPKNVGMHANLARVWAACSGKYIAYLEGDDFWHSPHKLATQVQFMEDHPDCAVSGHHIRRILSRSTTEEELEPHTPDLPQIIDIVEIIKLNQLAALTLMFRKGVVNEYPPWLQTLAMADWPLILLHACRGSVGYIKETLATYRVHPGGVWSSQTAAYQIKHSLLAHKKMRAHLPKEYRGAIDAVIADEHRSCFFLSRAEGRLWTARYHIWRHLLMRLAGGNINADLLARAPLWLVHPWADWFYHRICNRCRQACD